MTTKVSLGRLRLLSLCVASAVLVAAPASGQTMEPQCPNGKTIEGTVRAEDGKPIESAAIRLQDNHLGSLAETKSDASGRFIFSSVHGSHYVVTAAKLGWPNPATDSRPSTDRCVEQIDFIFPIQKSGSPYTKAGAASPDGMEFSDEPNFTVAGVTDWTAIGGHGSDSTLRMSESLASEAAKLKPNEIVKSEAARPQDPSKKEHESNLRAVLVRHPDSLTANRELGELYLERGDYAAALPLLENAYRIDPNDAENEFDLGESYAKSKSIFQARERIHKLLSDRKNAQLYELAAELDDKAGDPLTAIQELEEATKLQPSEENYFRLGSELLVHRAVWQAVQELRVGAKLYPGSNRLQTALATALFAGARYQEAATELCEVADKDLTVPAPYLFLGQIQIAAPNQLVCVEPKLALFATQHPDDAVANYLYAMAIMKRRSQSPTEQDLQEAKKFFLKAIASNPQYGAAYLQIGIIAASRGEYQKAIRYYQKAIKVSPQLADAHYRLAVAYDRVSQPSKAKQEFQLHAEMKREQAEATEQRRSQIKQFLFAGDTETQKLPLP